MELQRYRWEVRTMAAFNSCSRWQREADCSVLTPLCLSPPWLKGHPKKQSKSLYIQVPPHLRQLVKNIFLEAQTRSIYTETSFKKCPVMPGTKPD